MKKFSNGGSVMFKTTMFLCVCAFLIGCGPNTVNVDGVMSTKNVGPTVVVEEVACTSNGDCKADQLCVLDLAASDVAKHTIMVCVLGCDADLETKVNPDGTSVTEKVAGTDTCQRAGDLTKFCDLTTHLCKEYVVKEPEPVKPDEPKPVDTVKFIQLKCCFDRSSMKVGMFAQLAWSTSSPENPENFATDADLTVKDGCVESTEKIERAKVFLGYWIELTQGKAQDWVDFDGDKVKDDNEIVEGEWLGAGENNEFKPESCTIDGLEVTVGAHMPSCGFGMADATDVSCLN